MNARRERLTVLGTEEIGPYTLLRLERGGLDAGVPVSSSCSRLPAECFRDR